MKSIRICILLSLFGVIVGLFSCGKDDKTPPLTVKFTNPAATYAEDAGTVGIGVTLSAVQTKDIVVNYSWTSPDTTAFLGADFTFATPSSITIPAGQLTGSIQIAIINDTQLDGNNNITLTLTDGTGYTLGVATAITSTLTITDNDVLAADQLQIDLYWFPANPIANVLANTLFVNLQVNVIYHDTTVQNQTFPIIGNTAADQGQPFPDYVKGAPGYSTTGFQTVYLNKSDPDQDYSIFVSYVNGSGEVYWIINLNGMGHTNDYADASFSAADAPTSSGAEFNYFGPFSKVGSAFTFSSRSSTGPTNLKFIKSTNRIKTKN